MDRSHPVTTIYGEVPSRSVVDSFTDIDVWGLNIYSGLSFWDKFKHWEQETQYNKKPMFIAEYGADAWNSKTGMVDEDAQAEATKKLTEEIKQESTTMNGVCSGGIVFEWSDEWWKKQGGSPWQQERGGTAPGSSGPWPDFHFDEEYWGLVTVQRQKRKAYFAYKDV